MGEPTERSALFTEPVSPKLFRDLSQSPTNEHQQLTNSTKYKGGWSFYLVLAGVATTLGCSLPVGYNISVINTPAAIIQKFVNGSVVDHYDVVVTKSWMNVLWSSVVAIFIVGGCAGSILGASLADKLGRRKATLLTTVISVVGAVLFLVCRAANSVELLILGRLIVGLSAGLTTSIVPMYLTELAPMALAGAMGVVCPMGVNFGVLVGQIMGLDVILGGVDDWPYLLAAYAVLVIICVPVIFILPESPKYLYVVKREEETALSELSRLRAVSPSILTEDLELLKEEARAAEEASSQQWSMLRVMKEPRLRLVLLLTCSMQAGQQTSGINAVFYYSDIIFRGAGLSAKGSQYATIGCGAINVGTALVMIKLLPKCGRRPLLLGSILAAAICLASLAVSIRFLDAIAGMPYVCMAAVFAYVLAYGFGLGPIPYFIASEMFEVLPRGAGMAWGSLANWAGNFLVGMTFPVVRDAIGAYSFIVFAAVTTALFVFQKFYFPETRGKTQLQITQLCSRGFRSRPLSHQSV
ncbi:solute carrier family 2, facilitated glucose transporter member 3-like isoform X1 [Cydia splendana]|uniref:solute carrier family 2, facilitated glucose transporter member 3-like isoform X1 n=1 Tax=Cydia splendana TaxID=1100963 RepID=UPI0028F4AB11